MSITWKKNCIEACQSGSELLSAVRSREAVASWRLLSIRCMLKLIGGLVIVRYSEAVCFWEGPLREAPCSSCDVIYTRNFY